MPSRTVVAALIHIRFNIVLVGDFIGAMDSAAFETDLKTCYATTRALEIISEASRSLPDDVKQRHPEIPWRQIHGAGNVYRHDYEEVVVSLIWQTATRGLAPLLAVVEQELVLADRAQD